MSYIDFIDAMGQDTSKKTTTPDDEFEIPHEQFRRAKLLPVESLIETTLQVDERDANNWEQEMKKTQQFENKDTLFLPQKHSLQKQGLCGNTCSLKLFFDNFPYLFHHEIENRMSMNRHFEESELFYLLYTLLLSAQDFSYINSKIGDVRPYNIFINDEGQVKIANRFSWPYEKANFYKTVFEKELTYLAPEEMALVAQNIQDNTTNKRHSETFSIGLTLLHSGLLWDPSQIYNLKQSTFNADRLNSRLQDWRSLRFVDDEGKQRNYSRLLTEIVAAMCNVQPNARINSKQILDMLRPQEERIMTLEPFDASSIPFPYPEQQQGDFKAGAGVPPGMVQSQSPPVNQGSPQQVYIQPGQAHYSHFKGYADQSHPPQPVLNQPPQPAYHQQVFQQYSVERSNPVPVPTHVIEQPRPQPVVVPSQPVHVSGQNATNILPNWATSTTSNVVNQPPAVSNYKTTTTTTKVEGSQFATSHITQSYQTSNPNTDFLKKIDEQLENSRKQFPS